MSEKVLNKVNNDIFSYDTEGGVFKMSRVMPSEIHHITAGKGAPGQILTSTVDGWEWKDPSEIGGGGGGGGGGGVPAPLSITTSSGPSLLDGNIESIDFTNATISGTNVEIDGNIIGTTVGTGVEVSETGGISTTEASYVDLNMSAGFAWTSNFTLEFYFKMPSGSVDSQQYNGLFSSFNGTAGSAFGDYLVVERRNTGDGIHFYTTPANRNDAYNTLYTESTVSGFDGTWGHLVLTNDSSQPTHLQKQMYVNGVLFTTGVLNVGSQVNFAAGTRDHYWVGRNGFGTFYENGVENLKIFRVYNRILTAQEAATLYENRDETAGSTEIDVTNYHLVSNNATGTETKWEPMSGGGEAVPAPNLGGPTLPDGNILNLEFTTATLEGVEIVIDGTVVGTGVPAASGLTVTPEDGLFTNNESGIALNSIDFTPEFTLEFYFKMIGGNYHALFDGMLDDPNSNSKRITVDSGPINDSGFRFIITRHFGDEYIMLVESNASIPGFDGNFGHLVCLLSATDGLKVYSNGVLLTPTNTWTNYNTNTYNHGTWNYNYLGRRVGAAGDNIMDNASEYIKTFRVYNRALSADEILSLYENRDMTSAPADITNYHLVSKNATGTETKWEPMTIADTPAGFAPVYLKLGWNSHTFTNLGGDIWNWNFAGQYYTQVAKVGNISWDSRNNSNAHPFRASDTTFPSTNWINGSINHNYGSGIIIEEPGTYVVRINWMMYVPGSTRHDLMLLRNRKDVLVGYSISESPGYYISGWRTMQYTATAHDCEYGDVLSVQFKSNNSGYQYNGASWMASRYTYCECYRIA